MKNFNVLMNYLTNPFQWVLKMPQFPSSKNGFHRLEAVKYLFHLVTVVFLVTLPGFIHFMRTAASKKATWPCTEVSSLWMMVSPVVLAVMTFIIGFDQFFTLFHQVLFAGDNTWLFDPRVDSIILALPEDYFMHAFLIFFVLYEGMLRVFIYFLGGRNEPIQPIIRP